MISNCIPYVPTLQEVLDSHKQVFSDTLGTLKNYKVKFYLEKQAKPYFLKASPPPLALYDEVAMEPDKLQAEGIVIPTRFSKWATPIMPVVKHDRSIRICSDFKQRVNKSVRTKVDLLPRRIIYLFVRWTRLSPPWISPICICS